MTEQVVDEARALGIRHLWMQAGAEHSALTPGGRRVTVHSWLRPMDLDPG